MWDIIRGRRHRGCLLLAAMFGMTMSSYFEQVVSLPAESNQWPTFPRRNIAALARDGYLKSASSGYKRSISTLAKNGQLPTFRSPYLDTEKEEQDDETSQEKRNMASIARLRSYAAMKRNIQALARDGYLVGRGHQQSDKRNIASLARNGLIHKKDDMSGEEYFYPFYQNPIPPLSEIDGPFDANELYDYQQSVNPDMFPPLSQLYKRNAYPSFNEYDNQNEVDDSGNFKRGSVGLPALGLYRPMYIDPTVRTKRYVVHLPDVIESNDIQEKADKENEDKRSVGSIPLTRISELGNISLVPKWTHQSIQTTPTYRRRQYLLTRTRPVGSSTDR